MGRDTPRYPTPFAKYDGSLIGAHAPVTLPVVSDSVDWEVAVFGAQRSASRTTPSRMGTRRPRSTVTFLVRGGGRRRVRWARWLCRFIALLQWAPGTGRGYCPAPASRLWITRAVRSR
ncbi:hypothetical protein ACFOZ0_30305 [Streptomyces yaanensis]|uniref:Uncharacterized protein n=1 Tax=Streptomyces yaanensis TaxID=1142239 RepID=A0ABV7SKK4_9ACTN